MPALFSAITGHTVWQKIYPQVIYAAPFADLVAQIFHAISSADLCSSLGMPLHPGFPTMRLLLLVTLLRQSGGNTLFPMVGIAEAFKSAAFVPVVGLINRFTVPVVGTASFR